VAEFTPEEYAMIFRVVCDKADFEKRLAGTLVHDELRQSAQMLHGKYKALAEKVLGVTGDTLEGS